MNRVLSGDVKHSTHSGVIDDSGLIKFDMSACLRWLHVCQFVPHVFIAFFLNLVILLCAILAFRPFLVFDVLWICRNRNKKGCITDEAPVVWLEQERGKVCPVMPGPWSLRCITPWMQKWWRHLSRWGPWSRKPGLEGGLCNQSFLHKKIVLPLLEHKCPYFFLGHRDSYCTVPLHFYGTLCSYELDSLDDPYVNCIQASKCFKLFIFYGCPGDHPLFWCMFAFRCSSGSTLLRLTGYWTTVEGHEDVPDQVRPHRKKRSSVRIAVNHFETKNLTSPWFFQFIWFLNELSWYMNWVNERAWTTRSHAPSLASNAPIDCCT